jgi:hypothetical protein
MRRSNRNIRFELRHLISTDWKVGVLGPSYAPDIPA